MICENCIHYSLEVIPQDPDRPRGLCRRWAPKPRMREKAYTDNTADWPLVHPSDWCGEYAAPQPELDWKDPPRKRPKPVEKPLTDLKNP